MQKKVRKKDTILFVSINSISIIPVMNYIITKFISTNYTVILTENHFYESKDYSSTIKTNYIRTIHVKDYNKQSLYFKIKKYFVTFFSCLFNSIKNNEGIIIYVLDFQVLLFVLYLKLFFKKIKIIYHQIELIELEKLNKINLILFKNILKHINRIDHLIFPEINRAKYFLDFTTGNHKKVFIFPNTNNIKPESKIESKIVFDIPSDAFTVGHVGNLNDDYFTSEFFQAIDLLKDENIYFLIVGNVSEKIKNLIKGNQKVIFISWVSHDQLKYIYSRIELGIILYKGIDKNFEFCAPNKLYEYWAYGVPVIAHRLEGLLPVFVNELQGSLIDFNNYTNISKSILTYYQLKNRNKELLKDYFNTQLSIDFYLNSLIHEFENL